MKTDTFLIYVRCPKRIGIFFKSLSFLFSFSNDQWRRNREKRRRPKFRTAQIPPWFRMFCVLKSGQWPVISTVPQWIRNPRFRNGGNSRQNASARRAGAPSASWPAHSEYSRTGNAEFEQSEKRFIRSFSGEIRDGKNAIASGTRTCRTATKSFWRV